MCHENSPLPIPLSFHLTFVGRVRVDFVGGRTRPREAQKASYQQAQTSTTTITTTTSGMSKAALSELVLSESKQRKLTWEEFDILLRVDSLPAMNRRPLQMDGGHAVFRESPKNKRRSGGPDVDRWQNSGGKKGSTVSPDGKLRRRYGSVINTAKGVTRKYFEVSFNVDSSDPSFDFPGLMRSRTVFQVVPDDGQSEPAAAAAAAAPPPPPPPPSPPAPPVVIKPVMKPVARARQRQRHLVKASPVVKEIQQPRQAVRARKDNRAMHPWPAIKSIEEGLFVCRQALDSQVGDAFLLAAPLVRSKTGWHTSHAAIQTAQQHADATLVFCRHSRCGRTRCNCFSSGRITCRGVFYSHSRPV